MLIATHRAVLVLPPVPLASLLIQIAHPSILLEQYQNHMINTILVNTLLRITTMEEIKTLMVSLLSTIHFLAISRRAMPLTVAPLSPMVPTLMVTASTIHLTYTISPQMRRGNACCTTTLIWIRVTSMWRIQTRVSLLGILDSSLEK